MLVTSNEPHDKTPSGLWSFTPAEAAWRRLDGPREHFEGLVWGDGFLCVGKDIRRPPPAGRIVRLDLDTSRVTTLPPGYIKGGVPLCDHRTAGWAFMDDLLFSPMGAQAASGIRYAWSQGTGRLGEAIDPSRDEAAKPVVNP